MSYFVNVQQPWNRTNSYDNVSLVFTVEQDLLTELSGAGENDNFDFSAVAGGLMDRNIKNITLVKPTLWHSPLSYVLFPYHQLKLSRKVSVEKLSQLSRAQIPGIRVSWRYNDSVTPERNFLGQNRHFTQLANIVHESQHSHQLWRLVRESRDKLWLFKREKDCKKNMFVNEEALGEHLEDIAGGLNVTASSTVMAGVSEETLKAAAELYVYLIYCPTDKRKEWRDFYTNLLRKPLKTIILTLSSIMSQKKMMSNFEFNIASKIFTEISSLFDLKGRNIDQFLKMTAGNNNTDEDDITRLIGKLYVGYF